MRGSFGCLERPSSFGGELNEELDTLADEDLGAGGFDFNFGEEFDKALSSTCVLLSWVKVSFDFDESELPGKSTFPTSPMRSALI